MPGTGPCAPGADTLTTLAELYRAPATQRRRLLELAATVAPGRMDSQLRMQRGNLARLHDRIYAIERQAGLVRSYQHTSILGVLQTRAYTSAIFTLGGRNPDEVTALVDNRQRRNRMMMADTARRWHLIQPVAALDWNIADGAVMAAQLDAMAAATRLPNVRLGIVPRRAPVRFFVQNSFHIYDQRAVLIATVTATALSDNHTEITEYGKLFNDLDSAAVYDEPARELLAEAAEEYQRR